LPFQPGLVRQSAALREEMAGKGEKWDFQDREQGYQMAMEAFSPETELRPDGILVTSDNMTQGILPALARLKLEVGRDLQLATHANAGSTTLLGHEQELIRLEFSPKEIVETVFGMLEELMAGRTPISQKVLVQPRLRLPDDQISE